MDRTPLEQNRLERERLRSLLSRLDDVALARELRPGWSIAMSLAHLAFWDARALVLLARWKEAGVGPSPVDVDAVNDALSPILRALAPRSAAELVLSAAEAIDRALEEAPAELISAIELQGRLRLRRCDHRREHREEIERFLLPPP